MNIRHRALTGFSLNFLVGVKDRARFFLNCYYLLTGRCEINIVFEIFCERDFPRFVSKAGIHKLKK